MDLELSPQVALGFVAVTSRPSGLVVICGPSNSGKTSTAESLSAGIASSRPLVSVDLELPTSAVGVELDERVHALAGRIRAGDTALAACELSARTLAIATAGSGESTVVLERFSQLGVPVEMLVRASAAIVTQRLCRRLCHECRVPVHPSAEDLDASPLTEQDLAISNGTVFAARSCSACSNGYQGSVPLYEILVAEPNWRPGRKDQYRMLASMVQDAVIKVTAGLTSLAEITWMMGRRRFARSI